MILKGGQVIEQDQIMVIYGDKPRKMVPELLDAVGLLGELKKEYTIGLKPNLVVEGIIIGSYHRSGACRSCCSVSQRTWVQ